LGAPSTGREISEVGLASGLKRRSTPRTGYRHPSGHASPRRGLARPALSGKRRGARHDRRDGSMVPRSRARACPREGGVPEDVWPEFKACAGAC